MLADRLNPLLRTLLRSHPGEKGSGRLPRVLAGIFLLLPSVQIASVLLAEVNPWAFGGWGAFSAYSSKVTASAVLKTSDGSQERLPEAGAGRPGVVRALERYQTLRRDLGTFSDLRSIARAATDRGDVVSVQLAIRRFFPDRDGLVRCEGESFSCTGEDRACHPSKRFPCGPPKGP